MKHSPRTRRGTERNPAAPVPFVRASSPSRIPAAAKRGFTGILGTLAAWAAVVGGLAPLSPARAQTLNVNYYGSSITAAASGSGIMMLPRAFGHDIIDANGDRYKKIFLSWSAVSGSDISNYRVSTDSGSSWGSVVTTQPAQLVFAGVAKRPDGSLISLPFTPQIGSGPTTSFTSKYHISTDNGATWTEKTDGSINFPEQIYWVKFHRGLFEDNGNYYAVGYGPYVNDYATYGVSPRCILFESTDGGVNWSEKAKLTPAGGASDEDAAIGGPTGFNECTIERCADGSWLVVVREGHHWQYPLRYTRSTNKGANWSALAYLPGLGSSNPNRTSYDSDEGNETADPVLKLMPNGVMVLSWGRPNVKVAFSADGNGTNWTNRLLSFTEAPAANNTLGWESSCYTSVIPISTQAFLNFGDSGADWSYGTAHPTPNPYTIWQRRIEIVRPEMNRIDLKTKLKLGVITVTSDLTASDAIFPEKRVAGAVDGSTDYWSGAFKNSTNGTYTIDLQRNYTLNALGVCLQYGKPQSATIEVSTNGSAWSTIKSYTNATHYAVNYTSLSPTVARYVRVNVSGASSPVSLNEIELYETSDTFEGWAPNVALGAYTGYSAPNGGVWVGDAPPDRGYQSTRALFLTDANNLDIRVAKGFTSASTKTLEFWIKPTAFAASNGALQWRMTSGSSNVFRLRTISGGTVQWYNGTAYSTIAGASIPLNTWTQVKLVANASAGTASLYLNGVLKSSTIGRETALTTMNGFLFSSGGAAATGDQGWFDDVTTY